MKRFLAKWWLGLVLVGVGVLLLLLSSGTRPGGGRETSTAPGEHEEVLADPPALVLVRWRLPPGKELVYEATSRGREQRGQTITVGTVAGSLVLRARGADQMEAEFVLRKEKPTPGSLPEPEAEAEGQATVGATFTFDLAGRLVEGASQAREFYRIFGSDFALPEEGLRRGLTASSKTESPLGQGGSTYLVRGHTWVRTVKQDGYACLRIEGETSHQTASPPWAGQRVVTESTSKNVCCFAHEQGFIVELTLERAVVLTSSTGGETSALAGTTQVYQEASLRLLQARSLETQQVSDRPARSGPPAGPSAYGRLRTSSAEGADFVPRKRIPGRPVEGGGGSLPPAGRRFGGGPAARSKEEEPPPGRRVGGC